MSTAQQQFADHYANSISGRPNVVGTLRFAPGIVELTGRTAAPFTLALLAGDSHVAGGIMPFITSAPGTPYRAYIVFPSTMALGDTVKFHVDGVDMDFTLPAGGSADIGGVKYDGDWIDFVIPNAAKVPGAGDNLPNPPNVPAVGGSPVIPATRVLAPGQRALVVYEHNPSNIGGGRMFALDPANASGVPLPAFRPVAAVPATGTLIGEAIINTTTGLSYTWDGARWAPIVPPSIVSYPTDTDVLNDNAPAVGTYAFSRATGNFFVRFDPGTGAVWRQVGVRTYPTRVGLLADTPPNGSTGYATDTGQVWHRVNGAWVPASFLIDTEANIRALTPAAAGEVAVARDTGKVFASDGANWIGQPFRDYATEAALLADAAPNGVMAVAIDTGEVFYRAAGNWTPINRNALPVGAADPLPAASTAGQMFFNTTENSAKIFIGGAWQTLNVNQLSDLTDVDITGTHAPHNRDTLIFDGGNNRWRPGPAGGVIMGAEPAAATRFAGMLWWDSGRMWLWDTAGVWVEAT